MPSLIQPIRRQLLLKVGFIQLAISVLSSCPVRISYPKCYELKQVLFNPSNVFPGDDCQCVVATSTIKITPHLSFGCSAIADYPTISRSTFNGPFIQILEQPGDFHYRYKKEKFHGYIMAKNSPSTKRKDMLKFPTIKVLNCHQEVVVRCWLISTNLNGRPTATFHQLAMKKPKTKPMLEPLDFYASEINDYKVTLDYLYITHAVMDDQNDVKFYEKKKAWLESGTFCCPGYNIIPKSKKKYFQSIDKHESLLYFEVFDACTHTKLCEAVSSKIKNTNKYGQLRIVKYSRTYGNCKGGDEVLIFVEKVTEDVKVRFFELKKNSNYERKWEAQADFGPQHIHHKYGIAFRTPPFHDTSIKEDVNVFFELYRKADGAISDPVMFTYKPDESCQLHDFLRKRSHSPESTCRDYGKVLPSQCPKKKMREETIRPDTTYVLNDQPEYVINICDEALGNEPWKSIVDTECEAEGTVNFLEQVETEPINAISEEVLLDISYIESLLQNDGIKSDGIDKLKKEMKLDKVLYKVQYAEEIKLKKELTNEISSEVSSSFTKMEEDSGTTLPELKEMVKLVRSKKKTIIDFLNLLDNVRDINAVDFYGNSIFLFASEYSAEVLEALLSRKDLDRTLKNLDGDNALLCATRSGCPSLVECLLAHDFDPNVQNYKSGETPLHIAVGYELEPLVNILLKYGADPLIDNYGSQTAYDYSNYCVKEDVKKIIYEKAQEQFSKKRYPKYNGVLSFQRHNIFDDFERDLRRNLQNLRVAQQFNQEQIFLILRHWFSTESTLTTKECKLHKIDKGPSIKVLLNREDALTYYRQMQTIRRLETAAGNLYKEKLVRGFCHLYSGQEACAVGMKAAMRPMDSLVAAYRVHGWTYLMGHTVFEVLSELTGKRTGPSRGKGGSMHMYGRNFYGGHGIVGAQVPIGAGIALAAQYLKTGGTCFTLYGDGAANQGQVYEAFNMAKLWSLPCIFVCENNGYAMGTSVERSTASAEYYSRGDYVPGLRVDGMDVLAVREASKFAIDHCSNGKGPIILELVTYRYSGHSMSDPGTTYRTRDEVQVIRHSRDPISSFREKILSENLVSENELKTIDSQIKEEVDIGISKAKAETEIGPEEMTADLYVNCTEQSIRNITPWVSLRHINVSQSSHSL